MSYRFLPLRDYPHSGVLQHEPGGPHRFANFYTPARAKELRRQQELELLEKMRRERGDPESLKAKQG